MNFAYIKRIIGAMKRFNTLLVLVLLLLLPLQGLAAVTNSFFHQLSSNAHETQATHEEANACHQAAEHQSHGKHQNEKNHCVSACGQLSMVAITVDFSAALAEFTPTYGVGLSEIYLSVSLPKFQRPPIQIS